MSLLALIIDVSPPTWGHRHLLRTAQDKSQASKSKPSVGPATLEDVLTSCITLGTSFSCLHRDNTLVVIAATEEEAAVIYPRKGGEGNMENVVMGLEDKRVDGGLLGDYVKLGVAELVNRAVVKRERREELWKKRQERSQSQSQSQQQQEQQQTQTQSQSQSQTTQQRPQQHKQGAAIAAALSIALCTINRFMVASHAGVSALANASDIFQRREDDGILALMSGAGNSKKSHSDDPSDAASENNLKTNLLKPRALIIQASPDRTTDYNALMNCAFASLQSNIVIDGCFVPSGSKQDGHGAKSSPYMEQIVDQTRGVYLAVPGGAAQVGGALTEVLMSVFLPEPGRMRSMMNLPRLHSVDFRARCFESGESVDVAEVCNLCLSVFKVRPGERCWTCGAWVRRKTLKGKGVGRGAKLEREGGTTANDDDGGLKRMKLN